MEVFWDRSFFRNCVLDDVYRPHSFEEVAAVVSPEVAGRLDPTKRYGLWWFDRRKMTSRPVSEASEGGSRYGRKYSSHIKPKEEWIAVPVPDSVSRATCGRGEGGHRRQTARRRRPQTGSGNSPAAWPSAARAGGA